MTGQEQGTSRLWAKTASAATEEIFRLRAINTDLLAALKALLPTEHTGYVCAHFQEELKAARAAIEKAEGN